MKTAAKYKSGLLVVMAFFVLQNAYSQQDDDSLYEVAVISVYDNPDRAIELAGKIFDNNHANPERQIQALLVLSNAYASKRDYEKSLEYALKTNEINKKLDNPKLKLDILNKIAAQYHELGVNEKALQVLDEADLIAKNYPVQDSIWFTMGNNFAIRGFIYREQLSCDIAIDYLNRAYNSYMKVPQSTKSWANRSVTTYNKGNCFISLNQLDSAKISFLDARALAEKSKAKSLMAFAQKGLAEVYTLEGRYEEAISELESASNLTKEVGDLVLNRGIFKGLSENYLALKDWNNYHIYDEEYVKTEQQIKHNERKTINNLLQNYSDETSKKEDDLKWRYGAGVLIGLLVFLLVLASIIWGEIKFQKMFSRLKSQIKF